MFVTCYKQENQWFRPVCIAENQTPLARGRGYSSLVLHRGIVFGLIEERRPIRGPLDDGPTLYIVIVFYTYLHVKFTDQRYLPSL
jgi:hypothetical protein